MSDCIGLVAVERTSPSRTNDAFRLTVDVLNTQIVVPETLRIGSDVAQPVRFRIDELQFPQPSDISALEHLGGGIAVGVLVTTLRQDTAATGYGGARRSGGVSESCCLGQVVSVAGGFVELCCGAENDALVVCEDITIE